MINFIICEDEVELMNEYKLEIDKFMMNYDIDYKCYLFQSYDKKFEKAARDIEMHPSGETFLKKL